MSAPRRAGGSAERVARRLRWRTRARRLVALLAAGGAVVLHAWPLAVVAVVVAAWPDRRSGRWAAGAAGERRTAAALEGLEAEGWTVHHDVRLPGRRWNLDHVLVGPPGIVVVETKQWRDPVRIVRRHPRLLDERVGWQVDAVAASWGADGTPVYGFLCVHGAPVRRWWWTGARWAAVGDGRHLRRWLRRLPPRQSVFEPAA